MLAALPEALAQNPAKRLCIWPKSPQFASDDDLRRVVALCQRHGFSSISVYHLGLLPWRTVERVAAVLSA